MGSAHTVLRALLAVGALLLWAYLAYIFLARPFEKR